MKISRFIIVAQKDNDEDVYLIYNTRTTAFITMDKNRYTTVFVKKDYSDREVVDKLCAMGFLIEDDFDELKALEQIRQNGMDDPVQNVTINTTTQCNARCYYCFENGIKQYPMTTEVADATVEFIKKNYPDQQFAINWFGGEPLLNFDIIKYITKKLKESGYSIISHITTNGSLLTNEMMDYFTSEYEDFSFQITIDEIGEKYGKIKNYIDIDKADAYERVIRNIAMLLDNGITANIRLNFAASQIERAKEIYVQILQSLEGHDTSTLYLYFAPLTLDNENEIISNFHGDIEHPFLQAVKIQYDNGFPLYKPRYDGEMGMLGSFGLMPNAFSCGMTTKNRFSIDADGTLYKCHRLSGKKEYSCGSVFSGVDTENAVYKLFRNVEITDPECKECNILPICQAGCKSQRLLYGHKQKCHRIKQIQSELLNLYYSELCKKQEGGRV